MLVFGLSVSVPDDDDAGLVKKLGTNNTRMIQKRSRRRRRLTFSTTIKIKTIEYSFTTALKLKSSLNDDWCPAAADGLNPCFYITNEKYDPAMYDLNQKRYLNLYTLCAYIFHAEPCISSRRSVTRQKCRRCQELSCTYLKISSLGITLVT